MENKELKSDLLKETMQLMANRKHKTTVSVIAEATTLDKNWIYAFQAGTIQDPGVIKVEELNKFLKKELQK